VKWVRPSRRRGRARGPDRCRASGKTGKPLSRPAGMPASAAGAALSWRTGSLCGWSRAGWRLASMKTRASTSPGTCRRLRATAVRARPGRSHAGTRPAAPTAAGRCTGADACAAAACPTAATTGSTASTGPGSGRATRGRKSRPPSAPARCAAALHPHARRSDHQLVKVPPEGIPPREPGPRPARFRTTWTCESTKTTKKWSPDRSPAEVVMIVSARSVSARAQPPRQATTAANAKRFMVPLRC
jgi:hypothetical protein